MSAKDTGEIPFEDPTLAKKAETYRDLAYERAMLDERLTRVEEQRANVSPAIYDKVREEYAEKKSEIESRIEPLEVEFSELLIDCRRQRRQAKLDREEKSQAVEEFRFRQSIGEFGEAEATRLERENTEALQGLEDQIALLDRRIDFLVAMGVGGETAPPEAAHEKVEKKPAGRASPPARVEETAPLPAAETPAAEEPADDEPPPSSGEEPSPAWEEIPSRESRPPVQAPSFSGIFGEKQKTSEPQATEEAEAAGEPAAEEAASDADVFEPVDTGPSPQSPSPQAEEPAEREPEEERPASTGFTGIWSGPLPSAGKEEELEEVNLEDVSATEAAEEPPREKAGADLGATQVGAAPPPAKESARSFLAVIEGPNSGDRFDLIPTAMTIGREAGNTIHLNDSEISRVHAKIVYRDGSYVIQDQRSTNGTFVNDKRVEEVELKDNDHVVLGNSRLVVNLS
jgi:hypothetical protein